MESTLQKPAFVAAHATDRLTAHRRLSKRSEALAGIARRHVAGEMRQLQVTVSATRGMRELEVT